MKKFTALALAALIAFPAFAVTLKKGAHYGLTGNDGVSGKLSFSAKIVEGNKKFKIIFKNAKGDWLMFWHFEPASNKVFCYFPTHKCNHDLPGALELNKSMKFDISIANDRYAVLSMDGKEIACMALPKDKLHKVYISAEGGSMTLDDLQWSADAKTPMRFFIGIANAHRSAPIAKVPQGDYELSFDFVPTKLHNANGHYGIELLSAKKGDGKMQIVFWEKGFQVIRSKGKHKWLSNFPADFAGKKHTFTMKVVDSSLYEFFIDGKRCKSFEAEIVPGGDIVVWGHRNWHFEISDFSIKPFVDEDVE